MNGFVVVLVSMAFFGSVALAGEYKVVLTAEQEAAIVYVAKKTPDQWLKDMIRQLAPAIVQRKLVRILEKAARKRGSMTAEERNFLKGKLGLQ